MVHDKKEEKKQSIKIYPIKPYDDECKVCREVNPILPYPNGFVGILIGRIASGKSSLLTNLVARKELLGDLFGSIHIISNTINNDDSSRFIRNLENVNVYEKYSDELIRSINDSKKHLEKKDMEWDLIIGDDLLGSLRSNPPCELYQFATRLRHTAFNLLLLTQKTKCISPVVRSNTSFICVFWNNYADGELNSIEEEWGSFCGDKGFKFYYKKFVQKNPYSFLYMNFIKGIVMLNFEKLLYSVRGGEVGESDDVEENDDVEESGDESD